MRKDYSTFFDSTISRFRADIHKKAQDTNNAILSDSRQMDDAIQGEFSQAIRDRIKETAQQLDNIGSVSKG